MAGNPPTSTSAESEAEFFAYWNGDCQTCNRPRMADAEYCSAVHANVALFHMSREIDRLRLALVAIAAAPDENDYPRAELRVVKSLAKDTLDG